jgi:hypothetical protein
VRTAPVRGTAGVCWTQCNVCIALGRGLPWRQDVLVDEHRKHLGLPRPPPPPAPWPVRLPALPVVLADPRHAADLVHGYFEGRREDDRTPFYTGAAFERFAGGGDHPLVANMFTADDLVAVSMLSVQVPPRAALRILLDDADSLSAYLADVPADVDLADADEAVGQRPSPGSGRPERLRARARGCRPRSRGAPRAPAPAREPARRPGSWSAPNRRGLPGFLELLQVLQGGRQRVAGLVAVPSVT